MYPSTSAACTFAIDKDVQYYPYPVALSVLEYYLFLGLKFAHFEFAHPKGHISAELNLHIQDNHV